MITKLELSEGRMIAKLDGITTWQKRRIVQLFIQLDFKTYSTPKRIGATLIYELIDRAREHFLNN